ncbi:MAG: DUF3108 domain-containing protein [Kofleriaceae bacterium]
MRAALVALLVGCAGADATPLSPAAPASHPALELGFHPGENMTYEVQLAGVLVGEAQLAVGEIGMVDGKRAVVVKSRAATAGAAALLRKMVDESTTVIDVATGRPMQIDTLVVNGDKQTVANAKFTGQTAEVVYQFSGRPAQTLKLDFKTETVLDMHTAMAALRGWRATPGTQKTVFIIGGRRLWRIDLKYIGEETIGSKVGNRRSVVLEGTSFRARRNLQVESTKATRTFRVWLSDDADRVPLKVSAKTELGDIVMDLLEYNRPQ